MTNYPTAVPLSQARPAMDQVLVVLYEEKELTLHDLNEKVVHGRDTIRKALYARQAEGKITSEQAVPRGNALVKIYILTTEGKQAAAKLLNGDDK